MKIHTNRFPTQSQSWELVCHGHSRAANLMPAESPIGVDTFGLTIKTLSVLV